MQYVTKVNAWLRLKDGGVVSGAGVEFDGDRLQKGAADQLMAQGIIEPAGQKPPKTTKERTEAPVRKAGRPRSGKD